jgi:hypothetical protein
LGLSVVLEPRTREHEYIGIDERTRSRISFGIQVSRFYEAYFKIRGIEIWKFAPLKELEGIPLKGIEIAKGFVTREDEERLWQHLQTLDPVDRFFSVVRLLGTWEMEDHPKLDTYLTISNDPNWRRVYGDIELNVFPEGDIRDIVDLFYKDRTVKERLVDFFLTTFAGYSDDAHQTGAIYFTLGVPAAEDLDLWRTVSLRSKTTLLENSLARLRAIGGEEAEHALSPYSVHFLVRSLREIPQFDEYLSSFFARHQILAKSVGSVGFIGENPESFKEFFDEFAEKVLKPMIRDLPRDAEISSKIRNAVQKQTRLD